MKVIPLSVDRSSPVPLYHQLAEQLTAAIENGTLKSGDPFENELALAERLSLSRPTVRRAIAELVSRGLLVRRRGVGTSVANQAIHRRDELTSLYEDMEVRGQRPATRVLSFESGVVNPVVAKALDVPSDSRFISVERLRLAGDQPVALMHNWLPPRVDGLAAGDLDNGSLYRLLRSRGVRPVIAHQRIGARRPSGRERKLLHLRAGDPVLTMSRRAYDAEGAAVEYGDHCYRWDQYAFDLTVHQH